MPRRNRNARAREQAGPVSAAWLLVVVPALGVPLPRRRRSRKAAQKAADSLA